MSRFCSRRWTAWTPRGRRTTTERRSVRATVCRATVVIPTVCALTAHLVRFSMTIVLFFLLLICTMKLLTRTS